MSQSHFYFFRYATHTHIVTRQSQLTHGVLRIFSGNRTTVCHMSASNGQAKSVHAYVKILEKNSKSIFPMGWRKAYSFFSFDHEMWYDL